MDTSIINEHVHPMEELGPGRVHDAVAVGALRAARTERYARVLAVGWVL